MLPENWPFLNHAPESCQFVPLFSPLDPWLRQPQISAQPCLASVDGTSILAWHRTTFVPLFQTTLAAIHVARSSIGVPPSGGLLASATA